MSVKIVVIADTHIPERASEVPIKIKEALIDELKDAKILVHGGDLVGEEVLRWIEGLAPKVYVVKGNMDYLDLPEKLKFSVEEVYIGVVHGHQVYPRGDLEQLTFIAKSLKVDILISAHTHRALVKEFKDILHVNPGSLTGVWGGGGGSLKPSFAVVEIDNRIVFVKIYELEGDNIREHTFRGRIKIKAI